MFKNNYTVLIVDDETFVRRTLAGCLKNYSKDLIVYDKVNGMEAKRFIMENIVDIVITDILMPFMDGLELTSFIKNFLPNCIVIIISGHGEFDYAQKAIKYGVKEYLLKPIQLKQLCDCISNQCNYINKKREKFKVNYNNIYEEIEASLYAAYNQDENYQELKKKLNSLTIKDGKVIKIIYENKTENRKCIWDIFKNILEDLFPTEIILKIGFLDDVYEYLMLNARNESLIKIMPVQRYLCQLLDRTVRVEVACEIGSIVSLSNYFINIHKNNDRLIDVACKYIDKNYQNPISRYEVASFVHLTPEYFSHLFKKEKNVGFNEYLTELRISRAKQLLSKNITIKEVGQRVGYNDAKYFSKIFWARTGYMPSDYRKLLINENL